MIPKISSAPPISFTLDLLMTRISLDHNTSCPKYICALIKNSPPNGFLPSVLCVARTSYILLPNSCFSVLFVPLHTIWCFFGAFRCSCTHCFHVVFVCLWSPLWSKKSSPEKELFSACRERICFAYCSLGFSGCQVIVSTLPDK